MESNISEECSVIAFYGIETNIGSASFVYDTAVSWFTKLGRPPDKIGIRGRGQPGKLGEFRRGNARLQKDGFDNVTAFELSSSMSDGLSGSNYYVTAIWSAKYSCSLIAARSSLATLSEESMLSIARKLISHLNPRYGVGYLRECRNAPELYAIGLNYSSSVDDAINKVSSNAYEESMSISGWSDAMEAHVWDKGILRDVYPWNFLNRAQLAQHAYGDSLARWIRSDPRRGTLEEAEKGACLWQVSAADLPHVRAALREAGITFDWRKQY